MDVEQFLDQPTLGPFINGTFITPSERERQKLVSPVTSQPWKEIIPANGEDTQLAIDAAERTLAAWKKTPAPVRSRYLRKIGDLMIEHEEQIVHLMATEVGKPVTQGKGEASYAAEYLYWFAGEAERIYGQTIPSQFENKKLMITHEPIGVCAAITPWNFPLAIPVRKIAAALAAGCTVVNKPSSESPIMMLLFAHLCKMSGLPAGVVNIVPGPEEEIGEVLLKAPTVRKLSFTGSTAVGKLLYAQSAATLKKLTLELGGHAPFIVFDDADVDKAVEGTIQAKFRYNGQTCVCPNRILVQEGISEAYTEKLIEAVKKLRLGDPYDPATDLTAAMHPSSVEKVKRHIQDALAKGACAVLKGEAPYEPVVLTGVTPEMTIFHEETFGPVAPLTTFSTEEEGLSIANASDYGLASYVFTTSLERGYRAVDALEYGMIGLNDGLFSSYQSSFGGIRSSGFGREGGPTGIREYLVEKFISLKVNSG